MKSLLELKGDYKKLTGVEWKPGCAVAAKEPPAMATAGGAAEELKNKCEAQGAKVRQLKSEKADKVRISYLLFMSLCVILYSSLY